MTTSLNVTRSSEIHIANLQLNLTISRNKNCKTNILLSEVIKFVESTKVMDRRPVDFPLLRSSPHPEFDQSAPSPESVVASPMLISSRTSECGDAPVESDEGYGISDSGETSRRSTISRMDMVELSRDLEVKNKYPELYQMIVAQRRFGSAENRDSTAGVSQNLNRGETVKEDDSKQLLYAEAIDLLKRCRKQERQLRDMQKNYDGLLIVNRQLKETYVKIYAKAEQEEEYISNILLKRIQKLKNDKETLAQKYEQEEEFLTNDLMRKIKQLQSERDVLEGNVKNEQANVIDGLLTTIRRMESEMAAGRKNMDRMRKEKIDQENALEHEQELLFNTLGKQMDQLSQEKRKMQASLQKAYLNGFVDDDEVVASLPQSE
ncbi:hypothetical protein KIN20_022734 [Parelaphostrongylus tenuis]|uniref:Uncharacterized protein n=1 Tax=Parelaphostrongylus tenuis TaxID=148309 RepID=A0AAD5N6E9_PARTN|nr:hypothetical protein KIN20_022734 [Parelaphostrongylus tenuis]